MESLGFFICATAADGRFATTPVSEDRRVKPGQPNESQTF